jgi:hypothetical protein
LIPALLLALTGCSRMTLDKAARLRDRGGVFGEWRQAARDPPDV